MYWGRVDIEQEISNNKIQPLTSSMDKFCKRMEAVLQI